MLSAVCPVLLVVDAALLSRGWATAAPPALLLDICTIYNLLLSFCFWETGSHYWPWLPWNYVEQAGLKPTEFYLSLPLSAEIRGVRH